MDVTSSVTLVEEPSSATPQRVGCTLESEESFQATLVSSAKMGGKASNAAPFILETMAFVKSSLSLSSDVEQIMRTIVRTFCCFINDSSSKIQAQKNQRLGRCMCDIARNLQYFEEKDLAQQYVKYWVDKVFATKCMNDVNAFPVNDIFEGKPMFAGFLRVYIARRTARGDTEFFYSLQKGMKQAWPALSKRWEVESLKDHLRLCCDDVPKVLLQDVQDSVKGVSREVFRNLRASDCTKFAPTGSACMQASRREGGTLSLVAKYRYPWEGVEGEAYCPLELQGKSDLLEDRLDFLSGFKGIGLLPQLNYSYQEWRDRNFKRTWEGVRTRIGFDNFTWGVPQDKWLLFDVKVQSIPEPGKFRIITKGDGYLYNLLQPLQGAMLKCWKENPASTMRHDDLLDRIRLIDHPDFDFWASVDYKAATDTLSILISKLACEGIPEGSLRDLALFSLEPGKVVYPSVKDKEGNVLWKGVVKTRHSGQLMGHPLSFPLLCVINLSVWRLALERWAKCEDRYWEADYEMERHRREMLRKEMKDLVIVNGDDMAAKVDKELYKYLLQSAMDHGFKLSAGKNYLSAHTIMINSQVYRRGRKVMLRRGYLNQRIIEGRSPKSGESRALPTQIGMEVSKMVARSPRLACMIPEALDRFKGIRVLYTPPNWYLPVHLGGYGVDPKFGPSEIKVTRGQRILAAHFINNPKLGLFLSKGKKIPRTRLPGALSKIKMVAGDYVPEFHESSTEADPWLERLCMLEQLHDGTSVVDEGDLDLVVRKVVRNYRLRPTSLNALKHYWSVRYFFTGVPSCPPAIPLRVTWPSFDELLGYGKLWTV